MARRLRVVCDTSVLVSALGFRGDVTGRIWHLAEEEAFDLFASAFILEEFRRVLVKRANLPLEAAELLTEEVRLASAVIEPTVRISVITKDDADNRILECAVNMKHIKPLG